MISVYSNAASCIETLSFKKTYLNTCQRDDIFFIKGIAGEVHEHGRIIEVIEDLKGNFDGESSIVVWGRGSYTVLDEIIWDTRTDNIIQYQEQDTLIMLVGSPNVIEGGIEATGDYATLGCAVSVLKLSNGYVTGRIDGTTIVIDERSMEWEELQADLQALCDNPTAIRTVKIKNNIYQQNGTIFFENLENKAVKLSFYNLSGKLVHEAITTSDNYRPVLAGNIFVCKININDDLQTIKYVVP